MEEGPASTPAGVPKIVLQEVWGYGKDVLWNQRATDRTQSGHWSLVTGHVYLMGFQFSASDVGLASLGWTSCLVFTDLVLNVSSIVPWVG